MLRTRKPISRQRASKQEPAPSSLKNQQYYQAQTRPADLPRKKAGRLKNFAYKLIFIGFAALIIYNSILDSKPSYSINSSAFRPKAEYQALVDAKLRSIFNRNKVTLNKTAISNAVRSQFPEVSDVIITTPTIGKTLDIDIKVINPRLILKSGSDLYVIDEHGRAVAKNLSADTSKFTTISDQTGFEVKVGKQVLTVRQVQFMLYISNQSKLKSINIRELVLPAGSSSELFMYLVDKPYYVKFIMDESSADIQLGSYIAVISELSGQGKQPSEYIDVRVEGKAFVK